jgi:hypothetical protein
VLEIDFTYVVGVIGALAATIGALWKMISLYIGRERKRNDDNELELKNLRDQHMVLVSEVGELKGEIRGQRDMSRKVLEHITKLKNDAKGS